PKSIRPSPVRTPKSCGFPALSAPRLSNPIRQRPSSCARTFSSYSPFTFVVCPLLFTLARPWPSLRALWERQPYRALVLWIVEHESPVGLRTRCEVVKDLKSFAPRRAHHERIALRAGRERRGVPLDTKCAETFDQNVITGFRHQMTQ